MQAETEPVKMINIVLDTNIIISAALSSKGNPAKIIRLIAVNDSMQIYYSHSILDEYKKVLSYERLNLSDEKQTRAVNLIEKNGMCIQPETSDIPLPDESDRIYYDTAKAVNAYLITGNLRHYPDEPKIVSPARFVEIFGK